MNYQINSFIKRSRWSLLAGATLAAGLGIAAFTQAETSKPVFKRATNSSPIAITSDNKFVWSVNPDNDSVSVFRVAK